MGSDKNAPDSGRSVKPAAEPGKTEKKLLRIFSDFASQRYKPIKASDNIFEIGIDSLDILQIMLEIERAFKSPVRFSDFVLHPTANELAAVVRRSGRRENVSILREGAGRPLVLVFDMSRDIASYYPLLTALDALDPGYPVFGVSSGFVPAETSLEEYSGSLAEELLEKGRFGLCDLAGYSCGGVVALEIARQLGDKAGNVFLIDAPNYKIYPKRLNYGFVLENLFLVMTVYGMKGLRAFIRNSFRDLRQNRTMAAEGKKLINMINNYDPEKTKRSVILFATSEMEALTDKWLGWQAFIADDKIERLNGRHITIIKKEAPAISLAIKLWRNGNDFRTII